MITDWLSSKVSTLCRVHPFQPIGYAPATPAQQPHRPCLPTARPNASAPTPPIHLRSLALPPIAPEPTTVPLPIRRHPSKGEIGANLQRNGKELRNSAQHHDGRNHQVHDPASTPSQVSTHPPNSIDRHQAKTITSLLATQGVGATYKESEKSILSVIARRKNQASSKLRASRCRYRFGIATTTSRIRNNG
jgi:hypothetical protein